MGCITPNGVDRGTHKKTLCRRKGISFPGEMPKGWDLSWVAIPRSPCCKPVLLIPSCRECLGNQSACNMVGYVWFSLNLFSTSDSQLIDSEVESNNTCFTFVQV